MLQNNTKTGEKSGKSRSVSFQNVPKLKSGLNKGSKGHGRKEIDRLFNEINGEKLTLGKKCVIM